MLVRKVVRMVKKIGKKLGLGKPAIEEERSFRERITERPADKPLSMTWTGEFYQPARLHYQLFDRDAAANSFSKLRCMEFDPDQKRWMWLYHGEAKKLVFGKSYSEIPKEKHPIILGSFFAKAKNSMYMDTNSFDRVVMAIEFFDKYLDRSVAKATSVQLVNRLFGTTSDRIPKHEEFFGEPRKVRPPEDVLAEIERILATVEDVEERRRMAFHYVEQSARKPLPEVETFPVHFYEEGIRQLQTSLRMRTTIAYQHWLGNTSYSMYDLIQEMIRK